MTNRGRRISLRTELIYCKVEFHGCISIKAKNAIIDIADPNRSTRTLRARATKIIPPHEIEFSEGVSIFIRERKINIIMAHIIKDGQTCFKL